MRRQAARPTGVERSFAPHEFIVTKTDTRGVIRYANDVFLRMSALREDEAVGAPHSVVRHPDMPRGVYHLLWSTIQAGEEVFAYVVNLAKDGAHYWVLAHVTPSRDSGGSVVGYHSHRRRPERAAIEAIAPVYALMRAEEQRHPNAREAAAAGAAVLADHAAARGFTYEELVWDLTATARTA